MAWTKARIATIVWCVAGVLLLGAVFAVSECDRKVARHFHRKLRLNPRRAEDAITPVAKDPDRHAQFLERAKQGNIDVVFLGASITDRWPRVGEGSCLKLAPYKPANFGSKATVPSIFSGASSMESWMPYLRKSLSSSSAATTSSILPTKRPGGRRGGSSKLSR